VIPKEMATKQSHIPAEVWRIIFCYSTGYQGLLDTSSLHALSDEPRAWSVDLSQVTAETKLSLALVSKAWNNLVLPLLYEHIPVYNVAHIPTIALLLGKKIEGSADTSDGSDRVGRYVKRIDILFTTEVLRAGPRYIRRRENRTEAFVEDLISICRMSPNLIIFSDANQVTTPQEVITAVVAEGKGDDRNAHRLSYINWYADAEETLPPLIRSLTQMASVEIISLNFLEWSENDEATAVSLPNLHTLRVSGFKEALLPFLTWCAGCALPSLQRFKILCRNHNFGDIMPFLRAHGPKLSFFDWNASIWPGDQTPSLEDCSALLSVVVYIHSGAMDLLSSLNSHPTVTRITLDAPLLSRLVAQSIQFYQRKYVFKQMGVFDWYMTRIQSLDLPQLRSMRMQGLRADSLRDAGWDGGPAVLWKLWIDTWAARNVRFEDTCGTLLVVPETWTFHEEEDESDDSDF
jgi:hypothetical protein